MVVAVMCQHCGGVVDWAWRWCPDCGRALAPADLAGGGPRVPPTYVVDWTIAADEPAAVGALVA
ncbi:MAG: hypothetical protein M0Z42_17700 [Actinomycetota bacterium]|nr:hypothetical protein [Actinomycetota bacterium]